MYEGNSVCALKTHCCCLKIHDQIEIKEISNPMPMDSIFQLDLKTNTERFEEKINHKINKDNWKDNSFHSKKKNVTIPLEQNETFYQNSKNEIGYQEIITNDGKWKKNNDNSQTELSPDHDKKKMNLIFITNRILVAKDNNYDKIECDKTFGSLNIHYGKHLKVFHMNVRTTMENPHKEATNTLSSLPYLMPFLNEIYHFLTNISIWLRKSRKNIILVRCKERSCHLLEALLRFIANSDEINDSLLKPESIILTHHEMNALLFYEKLHLEKFINPSLKRYVGTVTNIVYGINPYQSNPKHLHVLIIKNLSSVDKNINKKYENSQRLSDCLFYDNKLQTIFITVYQNFHLIHTSYKIQLNEEKETDKIIYIIDPVLPINGDILIIANATNKLGFQHVYFRIQFHTCWLHGDSISFKNSELDISKDCIFKPIAIVELYFKLPGTIIKEHENLLLSNKYYVDNNNICIKDIFAQLKLLDYSIKKNYLSYKAGPLDGNLYASIPKPYKSIKKREYENPNVQSPKFCNYAIKDSSIVSKKFNILEKEISNAAELLSSTIKFQKQNLPTNFEKSLGYHNKQKEVKEKTINENIRELVSNSKVENKFQKKINDDKNNLLQSSTNGSHKQSYNMFKSNIPNTSTFISNTSRYDNFNSNRKCSTESSESEIVERRKNISVQETEKNTVINRKINEHKFVSNLNESLEKPLTRTISKNSHYQFNDNQENNKNLEVLLYDNLPLDQSSTTYNASVTQNIWYKSNFTRQNAILYLINKSVGHFVIRPSTSLWKSLSIAIKCSTSIMKKIDIDDDTTSYIRHFIIDCNAEGYRIRGFVNEKYFKTLVLMVQDHVENSGGLPCKLILPQTRYESNEFDCLDNFPCQDLSLSNPITNDFNVIYLGSFILTNLFDNSAISFSIDKLQEKITNFPNQYNELCHTKMTIRLTRDRIIFTDLKRKLFFRKYCKLTEILCCEVDPKRRVWKNLHYIQKPSPIYNHHSPIFGIVSCLPSNQEFSNQACCQLFCTLNCNSEEFCVSVKYATSNILK